MDTLKNYQQIIKNILAEYVKIPYSHRELENK